MALEEEMSTVVVVGISALLIVQDQIGVLVGFGLGGFALVPGGGQVARCRNGWAIVAVAVVALVAGILEFERTLGDDGCDQLRRENVRSGHSNRFGIGRSD